MRFTHFLPLVLVLNLSCSTPSPLSALASKDAVLVHVPEREPSSSEKEENLKVSFETLMNSSNPEKEFLNYLSRLKSIFLRAEASMAEFDREIDEAIKNTGTLSFQDSKSYKKLMVMYSLSHRLQDKIIYHYLKLSDMMYDKTLSLEKRKQAKKILLQFKAKLDSKNPIEKISYDELRNNIAMGLRERRGYKVKNIKGEEVPVSVFKDEAEKIAVLRKYRSRIREIGETEQVLKDELTHKIESESEKIELVDVLGREPQGEKKFFASTGTNGNIMGLIFPRNVWALTFDDGPHPVHTVNIMKNLEAAKVKASFFWLAQNVVRYPQIVELGKENQMTLANHSWSHAELPKQDAARLHKEIVQSTEVEAKAYGSAVKFFRCPYGAGNSVPKIRKMIADLDMLHVFWNVDSLDWQDKDSESILARTKKQMQLNGRGVVLFHDIHPQSVLAAKKLIDWTDGLKGTDKEVRWVKLPDIVDELNGEGK